MGRRHGSDPTLLWLWRRPEATALNRFLTWELPHAAGAALKDKKTKKKSFLKKLPKINKKIENVRVPIVAQQ